MTEAGTSPKLAALKLAASRRLTPYGVLMEPVPKWTPHAFHRRIAAALEWVERTPDARLIIQGPPRVGKTVLGSTLFSPWFLGRNPTAEVLAPTYAVDRANDIGRRVRGVLVSPRHAFVFPSAVPLEQHSAATRIDLASGGVYRATSFSSGATGRGADLLNCDDPNKGPEQARSALWQTQIKEQWRFVFRPRVNAGGRIVVAMARYGADDFVGWLLAQGDEDWRVIAEPMVDANDNPLVPELFDRAACDSIKRAVGSRSWESLYMQRPSPDEAAVFNRSWWKFHGGEHDAAMPARFDDVITVWDMKLKDLATSGSYVCGQCWGRAGGKLYLLDQARARWNFADSLREIVKMQARYPHASALCVEEAAAGPVAIQVLRQRFSNVVPIAPLGSKVARAEAVSPCVESGSCYLPREPWVDEFIDECHGFPGGQHDDQVDCMVHALARMTVGQAAQDTDAIGAVLDGFGQTSTWTT